MKPIITRWWPRIGWAAVLVAYPFDLHAVTASGALIGTVGYVTRIEQLIRPKGER